MKSNLICRLEINPLTEQMLVSQFEEQDRYRDKMTIEEQYEVFFFQRENIRLCVELYEKFIKDMDPHKLSEYVGDCIIDEMMYFEDNYTRGMLFKNIDVDMEMQDHLVELIIDNYKEVKLSYETHKVIKDSLFSKDSTGNDYHSLHCAINTICNLSIAIFLD